MDEKRYLVRYKSVTNEERYAVITMPEEDYRTNMLYKENVQHALRDMSDNGGVWVDDKTLIPFHRVLALECYEERDNSNRDNDSNKDNRGNGGDKYRRRHGRRSRGLIKSSNQVNSNQTNGSNTVNAIEATTNTTTNATTIPPSNLV